MSIKNKLIKKKKEKLRSHCLLSILGALASPYVHFCSAATVIFPCEDSIPNWRSLLFTFKGMSWWEKNLTNSFIYSQLQIRINVPTLNNSYIFMKVKPLLEWFLKVKFQLYSFRNWPTWKQTVNPGKVKGTVSQTLEPHTQERVQTTDLILFWSIM